MGEDEEADLGGDAMVTMKRMMELWEPGLRLLIQEWRDLRYRAISKGSSRAFKHA